MKVEIKRTHDKFYLNENYKKNPKEYFKLVENEAKRDLLLKKDASISWLDIGCETGSFLYYLRGKYPYMRLTGMDVMQELLEHINDDIEGEKIVPFLGDITDTSKIPNEKYDAITMTGVIQIFDDFENALNNAIFLLKDEGVLYMLSIFNPEPYDVFVKYRPAYSGGGIGGGMEYVFA